MRRRKPIDDQDCTSDEHHDDIILQRRIEPAMRAQERKLRELKVLMKREDQTLLQLPSFKKGGSRVDMTDTG